MSPSLDFHIKLPTFHAKLMEKLTKRTGMNRTELVKWAIYRLAQDEKVVASPPQGTEDRRRE